MTFKIWCKNLKLAAIVVASFAHGSLFAEQLKSAYDLVVQTARASKELSYQGVFTYEFRGQLRSVKVLRLVRDGQTFERAMHMDGMGYQVSRRGDDVDCLRPGHLLLQGADFKSVKNGLQLNDLYNVYIRGNRRIAGRLAYLVEILPKDKLRYGYVVAIDKENGLMLQSMIISQSGKPIERFQYVDISFSPELDGIQIPEQWLSAPPNDTCRASSQSTDDSLSKWQPTWLPPGFVLSNYEANNSISKETWIYTDGLATFSVFIDSAEVSKAFPPVQATLGTTVAVLNKVNMNDQHYAITVVGEIPTLTAQQIVADIRPRITATPVSE
jgi:sigma-E factor negative regulatory protein RseB